MENYTWQAIQAGIASIGKDWKAHESEETRKAENIERTYNASKQQNFQNTIIAEKLMSDRRKAADRAKFEGEQHQKNVDEVYKGQKESAASQKTENSFLREYTSEHHVDNTIKNKSDAIKKLGITYKNRAKAFNEDLKDDNTIKFDRKNLSTGYAQRYDSELSRQKQVLLSQLSHSFDPESGSKVSGPGNSGGVSPAKMIGFEDFKGLLKDKVPVDAEGVPIKGAEATQDYSAYEMALEDAIADGYGEDSEFIALSSVIDDIDKDKLTPAQLKMVEDYEAAKGSIESSVARESEEDYLQNVQGIIQERQAELNPYLEARELFGNQYNVEQAIGKDKRNAMLNQRDWSSFAMRMGVNPEAAHRIGRNLQKESLDRIGSDQVTQKNATDAKTSKRNFKAKMLEAKKDIVVAQLGVVAAQGKQEHGAAYKAGYQSHKEALSEVRDAAGSLETMLANVAQYKDKFSTLSSWASDIMRDKAARKEFKGYLAGSVNPKTRDISEEQFKLIVDEFHDLQTGTSDLQKKLMAEAGTDKVKDAETGEIKWQFDGPIGRRAKHFASAIIRYSINNLKNVKPEGGLVAGTNEWKKQNPQAAQAEKSRVSLVGDLDAELN